MLTTTFKLTKTECHFKALLKGNRQIPRGTPISWSMHMLGRTGCAFGNLCVRKGMIFKSVCQKG